MELRKILIIANQFPPMGGSGVQRTSKFVKYLPLYGYEPIVLTRDDIKLPIRDDSLLSDIPEGTVVIRTKSYDYTNLSGIMRIPGKVYGRLILVPDSEKVWAKKSFAPAIEAIKKHQIKYIYSTSAPYSDHLLALKIKRAMPEVKWVADFRDEWTNNPYILDKPHNKIRTNIEKNMERDVLFTADALVSNTPVMVNNFVRLNNLKGDNFYCIPNGYDIEDFTDVQETKKNNEKFTLVYTGALYGRRKPDTFFEALRQLLGEGKVSKTDISISLIGNYREDRLNADIERYGLKGIVNIVSYMPHNECIKRLTAADCLLLLEGSGRGSDAFYTGKIFEYMMSKAAVLAVIPKNGAAAGLVRDTNIGIVADFENINEIRSSFMVYYNMWKNKEDNYSPNYGEIAKFERRELAKKLGEIYDCLD